MQGTTVDLRLRTTARQPLDGPTVLLLLLGAGAGIPPLHALLPYVPDTEMVSRFCIASLRTPQLTCTCGAQPEVPHGLMLRTAGEPSTPCTTPDPVSH
jgi:hypothetical protein